MDLRNRVGLRIRTLRKAAGLSQDELAARMERSVDAISAMERGKSLPGYETLERLSVALGISIEELFDSADESGSTERRKAIAEIGAAIRSLDDRQLRLAVDMIMSIRKNT